MTNLSNGNFVLLLCMMFYMYTGMDYKKRVTLQMTLILFTIKRWKELLNISKKQAQQQFGFFLKALQYGAPPHGGIAFGLDRIIMILTKTENIRDVIAFPKTQRGQCLMTQAPSDVDQKQLDELNLRTQKHLHAIEE